MALQESERRYRRLVEQVPDIIVSLDTDGRFTFVNAQIEKFLGYPVEQLLKTFFWNYATAEYRSLVKTILNLDVDHGVG